MSGAAERGKHRVLTKGLARRIPPAQGQPMQIRSWTVLVTLCGATIATAGQENVMRPAAARTDLARSFVRVEALDLKSLLPSPPAPDSPAGQAELMTLLQVQAWRTPEQIAWAKLIENDSVFNHVALLGPWFTADRLPTVAALFKRIGDDLKLLDTAAKKIHPRARPYTIDPRVEPCVAKPASTSYPSGSGAQSFVWAELLSEMFPAKRDALLARAEKAAWARVIGGVHFPSDLVAGRRVAIAYLTECRKNVDFQAALVGCRAEIAEAAAPGKR
jgi:acid phosphatase (class A)